MKHTNKILYLLFFLLQLSYSMTGQEWLTHFDDAKKSASEKDRPIVLVFQGSDWCAPCIKLDREIWSTDTFRSYANTHFIMLKADFPKKKKNALPKEQQDRNNQLADKYNPQGIFPFVVVLNSSGTILGRTGYIKTTPEDYIKHLESFIKKF